MVVAPVVGSKEVFDQFVVGGVCSQVLLAVGIQFQMTLPPVAVCAIIRLPAPKMQAAKRAKERRERNVGDFLIV